MSLISALDVSCSGLRCEKTRMELIAQNIANMELTRTDAGGPYRRKIAVFQEILQRATGEMADPADIIGAGVTIDRVATDTAPPIMVFDPYHPDADQAGYVAKPNINLANEMVDSISASRAYNADITVLNATKSMAEKALTIGQG